MKSFNKCLDWFLFLLHYLSNTYDDRCFLSVQKLHVFSGQKEDQFLCVVSFNLICSSSIKNQRKGLTIILGHKRSYQTITFQHSLIWPKFSWNFNISMMYELFCIISLPHKHHNYLSMIKYQMWVMVVIH